MSVNSSEHTSPRLWTVHIAALVFGSLGMILTLAAARRVFLKDGSGALWLTMVYAVQTVIATACHALFCLYGVWWAGFRAPVLRAMRRLLVFSSVYWLGSSIATACLPVFIDLPTIVYRNFIELNAGFHLQAVTLFPLWGYIIMHRLDSTDTLRLVSSRFGRSISLGFGVFVATNVIGWWFLLFYFVALKYSGAPALNASQMQRVTELERVFAWGPAAFGLLAFVVAWTGCLRRIVRTPRS